MAPPPLQTTDAAEPLVWMPPTPSQTAGPFVSMGTEWCGNGATVDEGSEGVITIGGSVLDGAGVAVTDAMLEFWQADADERFPPESAPSWTGFARALTDEGGRYRLVTVKPGPVSDPTQAPHIDVSIFARGLMQRLVTRIYFSDEKTRNETDPVLSGVPSDRRSSLVAQRDEVRPFTYVLDIHLQGDRETVFFDPWGP